MLTGVEILLERMKTNPEEFIEGGYSKWSRVIDGSWAILSEDEREALQAGMIEAKREHFNGEVLRVLTGNATEQTTAGGIYTTHLGAAITHSLGTAPSKIIAPPTMVKQAREMLEQEFDKAYAEQDRILGLK